MISHRSPFMYKEVMEHHSISKSQVKMESVSKFMVITVMIFAAMLAKEVRGTKHTVGGSQGWEASTDFNSWTSTQIFKVGDQLVFKYTPGLHSVVEVAGKPEYEKCDISTALDSKSSGEDVIKLTKPGVRYFVCGTLGHCSGGMKLRINVVASTSTSTTPESSDESPSSSTAAASTDDDASSTTSASTSDATNMHLKDSSFVVVMLVFALVNICLMNAYKA